jgi:two-component system cell cycle sensor histidine kinase/response regulator CckA
MPLAVWGRSGPDLSFTHQNAASIAEWGDLRGTALADAPTELRELWRAQIAAVMTGQIVRARREQTQEGDRRILHDIIAPVVVEDRVVGVVGIAIDVTDEERARVRLQDAHKLESLGVLAGGIAHDFNNLLTAILGNASLLQMEYGNSLAMAGPLEQIEAAARRAAELCRQMLAYAGRGRFSLQPLDLNDLVRDMEELMSFTLPPNAAIELLLAPDVPPILGDDSQLRQLVSNLVSNAAEALHGEGGTITVRTAHSHRSAQELSTTIFAQELQDGDYVSLSVTDTGEGMTAATLSRIFDPFFSTRFTGRGLGLAAVVGIVRAHKGALRVESEPGSGAMFELLLPAQHTLSVHPAQVRHTAGYDDSVPLAGTVLVIDDELGVRSIARTVLEREGLRVVLAEDGERGVAIFGQDPGSFRAVLVDLTMPVMDGHETLQQILTIRPDVPAILMSGYTPSDIDTPVPHEFLQKPFTPTTLRAAIRRVLHGR